MVKMISIACLAIVLVFSCGCQKEYFRTITGLEVISSPENIVEISSCVSKGRKAFEEKPIGLKEITKTVSLGKIKNIIRSLEKSEITKYAWDIPDGYHLIFKTKGEDKYSNYIFVLCLDVYLDYEKKAVYSHFLYDETGVVFNALIDAGLIAPSEKTKNMEQKDFPIHHQ